MHARQQLLEQIKTLLQGVVTPPWRGVYVARQVPAKAALPALLIRQESEPAADSGLLGLRRQDRTLNISILAVMNYLTDPEDTTATLNATAAAIETAITQAAVTLADDLDMTGTEIQEEPDEAGLVAIALTWWLRYSTREGRPETIGTD